MRKDVRELIEYAEQLGFTNQGIDGRNHYRLTHPNGTWFSAPATPSDTRSVKNAKATLRRLSGSTVERPKSGTYRGQTRRGRFSMREAVRNRRDDLPDTYTIGNLTIPDYKPLGQRCLEAELSELRTQYDNTPTGALAVQIRDRETRLRLRVW